MDKILDLLLSLDTKVDSLAGDAYERHLTSIVQALNKTGANQMIPVPGGVDYLDVLHPWTHSVGYLYVLLANIRTRSMDSAILWRRTVDFLESYDPRQISYVQDQFKALVEETARYVVEIGKPILIISPLKHAIQRSGRPTTFSSLHTIYVQKCIEAKCYRDATTILDIDLTALPTKKEAKEICYQDLLEYFLYGGMVYIGLKNWRRALDFLTYAVAYPTGATCSAIQVEAYKKYLLVGLLLTGKAVQAPSGVSTIPGRAYRVMAKPYDGFVAAFSSGDPETLRKQAAYSMPIFTEDGNAGLATQCMDAFRRFKIARLTHTYVTLSVREIARRNLDVIRRNISHEETEECVLAMIERDEIRASLSHDSPSLPNPGCIIHFHNNPPSEKQNLKALEEQIARTVSVTKQAQEMGANLGLSKEFLQYLNRTTKAGDRNGHGVGSMHEMDVMDTGDAADHLYNHQGNSSFAFDEDIMHDHDSLDEDS